MKKNVLILAVIIVLFGIIALGLIFFSKQGNKSFLGKYSFYVENESSMNFQKSTPETTINISGTVISSASKTGINKAKIQCEISYNDISGLIIIPGNPSEKQSGSDGYFGNIAFSVPFNKNLKYHCDASAENYYDGFEEKSIGAVTANGTNSFYSTITLNPSSQQSEESKQIKIPSISKLVTYEIKGAVCELDTINDSNKSTCSNQPPTAEVKTSAQIYPYGIPATTVTCIISGEAVSHSEGRQQVKTIKTAKNGAFEEEMVFDISNNKEFTRTCDFSAPGFVSGFIQKKDSTGVAKNTTEDLTQILQRNPDTVEF